MATSDLISELNTDLNNAYNAIEGKGGTVPAQKNSNNLATAIESIPIGEEPYDPFLFDPFDGGEYGAIAFIFSSQVEIYYAQSVDEFEVNLVEGHFSNSTFFTYGDTPIARSDILGYAVGTANTSVVGNDNFLAQCPNLRAVYGLDLFTGTSIGSYFLSSDVYFNSPITLSEGIKTIGQHFMSQCKSFNSSITIPDTVTSIGTYFMISCENFNQPISIPTSLTTIASQFLSYNYKFNQPIQIPNGVTSIQAGFLNTDRAFNQPLTIPSSVTSIGASFLYLCVSFNQPLVIPNTVTSIGTSFLSNCSSFNSLITLSTGVITLPNSFMSGCSRFNQAITIPSSTQALGHGFLSNCHDFAQLLELPTSITSIGGQFMYNCRSFVGPLNVNTVAPPVTSDNNSLSTTLNTAPMFTAGVAIKGENAQGWVDVLPFRASTPYRRVYTQLGPDNPTLEGLKAAYDSGAPWLEYPVGTVIPDKWNGYDNPLIVAQYLDPNFEDGNAMHSYNDQEGVILVRAYADTNTQTFGTSEVYAYKDSSVRQYLLTTYLDQCSDTVKENISPFEFTAPNLDAGHPDVLEDKWGLMNRKEVLFQDIGDGYPWRYWQEKTGLDSASPLSNSGRIIYTRTGFTSTGTWLRNLNSTGIGTIISAGGGEGGLSATSSRYILPFCFIAKPNE